MPDLKVLREGEREREREREREMIEELRGEDSREQ